LRESITADIRETARTIVGEVAPHVSYAPYVEFGTWKMAAQPYMRPAYEENRGAILDLFRGNIALAL
jgi:HK97 gp10 family phage protein